MSIRLSTLLTGGLILLFSVLLTPTLVFAGACAA